MTFKTFALAAALLAGLPGATAFGFHGKGDQVVTYSNGASPGLGQICQDKNVNVVILSFVDKLQPGAISANFGGLPTGQQIKECQHNEKTVLVSLGGANFFEDGWKSDGEAQTAAHQVWNTYGAGPHGASAFNGVATNGFDLDFEKKLTGLNKFTETLLSLKEQAKNAYLTASPQCQLPDRNLGEVLDAHWDRFDAVFVQFYNNQECGIPASYGGGAPAAPISTPLVRPTSPAARRAAVQARGLNLQSWLNRGSQGIGGSLNGAVQGKANANGAIGVNGINGINGANSVNSANGVSSAVPTPSPSIGSWGPKATGTGSASTGKGPKIFFGTPGSRTAIGRPDAGYSSPQLLASTLRQFKNANPNFGGVSIWTYQKAKSENHENPNFIADVKKLLKNPQ
ncbi:class III chitinase [Penicillium capsulatum]|uniref:Class III chitinase n=1 Tax=Penicillium capsulatum TaxID=69766 RepID=A0A9W9I1J5_9EURO|nr:class III chitinase [Penicillium capsulatum]KAJ6117431.1 class III chitinase [Penicillium capsulatum]